MTLPRWVHAFSWATLVSTIFLLAAGALVTGTGSGLAVPDWPLSYGTLMPPMIGGVLYEHGHRMVAGTVAILTVIQAGLFFRFESRPWVRRLSVAAVVVVLSQALLGGMTVLFRLPPSVSIAHACLAQIFFCLVVSIVVVTSTSWSERTSDAHRQLAEFKAPLLILTFGFFLQLVLGATMRHTGAALAIPDFPAVFGGVFPPTWNLPVAIHWFHRMLAFGLLGFLGVTVARIHRRCFGSSVAMTLSGLLISLVFIQVVLGGMIVWLKRPIPVTTVHLVVGALCFGTCVALSVFSVGSET
jgi:heme a synthase